MWLGRPERLEEERTDLVETAIVGEDGNVSVVSTGCEDSVRLVYIPSYMLDAAGSSVEASLTGHCE